MSEMSEGKIPLWRRTTTVLLVILLVATVLRLIDLADAPPGLSQDEAANAWNAWCLLHTGDDQVGESWPIFYMHALGSNRTTPHIYATIPFQAAGGLSVLTTRLPLAVGGVLTVLLIYVVGSRMFSPGVGLTAAALLAVNPWHIQLSRQGLGAGLCPLFVVAALAAMLWARLPVCDNPLRRPSPWRAVLAGAILGAGCYGYQGVRMFLPALGLAVLLVTWRSWWELLKTRRGAGSVAAFVLAAGAVFAPLAWRHLNDPEISKRGVSMWVWDTSDTTGTKVTKALGRYPAHFGTDFLFHKGDPPVNHSVPGWGQFHWYMLPLMLAGVAVLLTRLKRSQAARILLVWVVLYPIGDLLTRSAGPHGLRSSPGLAALVLLAAVGTVVGGTSLWRRRRWMAAAAGCTLAIVVVVLNLLFYVTFFGGTFADNPEVYRHYHTDLKEACEWIRPRWDQYDAVFCTMRGMNQPYIITLVHLKYDADQWFADEKDVHRGAFDHYYRYGKMSFMYGNRWARTIGQLQRNSRRDRVAFILRPGEKDRWQVPLRLKAVHEIFTPDGRSALWICEASL